MAVVWQLCLLSACQHLLCQPNGTDAAAADGVPTIVADIGTAFTAAGITIRLSAVLTLKKAFTLHVQTAAGQHLVRTGLYHAVRHPAYSGSILSLLGVALTFRNIVAVCIVLFCCLICYSARIRVEEKALLAQFGAEYEGYKRSTHRLLPRIY